MTTVYIILIFSIIFILLTILLLCFRNNQWIKRLESNIKKVTNILTFSSVLLAIIAISITAIITIATDKNADIKVDFCTSHGELYSKESGREEIYLKKENNNKVSKPLSVPLDWKIRLTNEGNIATDNMIVRIEFDGMYFVDKIDSEYQFCNPIYGSGGYKTIEYKCNPDLYPNDFIQLPEIPFENVQLEENIDKKITMKISLYDEKDNSKEFKYEIELKEGEESNW